MKYVSKEGDKFGVYCLLKILVILMFMFDRCEKKEKFMKLVIFDEFI